MTEKEERGNMPENFVRVYLGEGDPQDIIPEGETYLGWTGVINGQEIPVRVYRAEVDDAEPAPQACRGREK